MTIKNYTAEFFKKLYFITVLILTALFTSFFVLDGHYNFLSLLRNNHLLKILSVICGAYLLILFCALTVLHNNEKQTPAIYSLAFSLILTGIVATIYIAIIGKFSAKRLLLNIIISLLGVSVFILKSQSLKHNTFFREKKGTTYLKTVLDKYAFYYILIIAAVVFSFFSLVIRGRHPYNFDTLKYILIAVCITAFIVYAALSVKRKTAQLFDAIIFALSVAAPLVMINLIFAFMNSEKLVFYILLWCIFSLITVILIILRTKFFSGQVIAKTQGNYFKKFNLVYGTISPIAIGLLLSIIPLILFKYSAYDYYIRANIASLYAIPYLFINAFCYLILICGEIYALIGVKRSDIFRGDFYLIMSISYSVISLITMISQFSLIGTIILAIALVYSVILIILRIKFVNSSNK